jgi:tetratricopeptide (TPR) repeat protein
LKFQNHISCNFFIFSIKRNSFHSYFRPFENFIQISEFTIKYQQACLSVRLSRIYYLERDFKNSLKFLKEAEIRLSSIQNVDSQESTKDLPFHLQENLRRISINYCKLKDFQNAKKYVKYPMRLSNDTSSLSYKEQLELKKRENLRIERELNCLSKDVVEQNHIVCFLSLALISISENDLNSFCELVEMMSRPNVTEFTEMPIIWWQRIISYLIRFGEHKQAQMTLSKFLLIHPKYTLGWYVLFLLGIVNMDKVNDSIPQFSTEFH